MRLRFARMLVLGPLLGARFDNTRADGGGRGHLLLAGSRDCPFIDPRGMQLEVVGDLRLAGRESGILAMTGLPPGWTVRVCGTRTSAAIIAPWLSSMLE